VALFARAKAQTIYRAYLRGRMRAAEVLTDGEAKQYADPSLPTPLLVAFVMGALADAEVRLPSEAEIDAEVASRLGPASSAAGSSPPPPEARAERPKWIGDPLPSPSAAG